MAKGGAGEGTDGRGLVEDGGNRPLQDPRPERTPPLVEEFSRGHSSPRWARRLAPPRRVRRRARPGDRRPSTDGLRFDLNGTGSTRLGVAERLLERRLDVAEQAAQRDDHDHRGDREEDRDDDGERRIGYRESEQPARRDILAG